jgi:hypothetical protein
MQIKGSLEPQESAGAQRSNDEICAVFGIEKAGLEAARGQIQ